VLRQTSALERWIAMGADLDSYNPQDVFHMRGEVSGALWDIAELKKPYEAYRKIPDAGHNMGAIAFPYLAAVFVEGNISYPVKSVLYLPMASVYGEDTFGRVLDAGHAAGYVMTILPAFKKQSGPLYPEDRLPAGKVDVSLKFVADPNLARLYSPVCFVCIHVIRGETPPYGGSRCRPGGSAGCP
jgi:hypothetical protein